MDNDKLLKQKEILENYLKEVEKEHTLWQETDYTSEIDKIDTECLE